LPLYGLGIVRERPTEPVYFVEGEKACEACWKHDLVAVTHGGGAATKDFGQSLDALKGRVVYLWADNDAPGAAFMTLVQAKLEGLGVDVRLVSVPIAVPAKADAFDYFDLGGTADQLHTASPYEPVITILAEDALRVAIPSVTGLVTFDFSEMEKGSRALDCALVISCQSMRESYNERLNLDSSSARTQLRRDLDDFFGKEHGWTSLLNKAVYRAREAYLLQERAVELFDVPDPMGEVMLIPPLTVADGPTIFFGDGSSGKSYIAFLMALCSVYGFDFVGHRVPLMRVMIVDYEDSESNVKRRINRLCAGLGEGILPIGIYYWNARGIPLKDQWEAIKRSCSKNGIGWLIIDSAAPASGGPPEDAVSALAFFRALKRIGLPALVIAHITKGEKTDKPFGSVFWHNEARRTWFVKRIQEEDSDQIDIGLYNRKVNDGRKPLPIGLRLTFDGIDGPVSVQSQSLADVPELLSETSAQNQIWETLTQPMTVAQLGEATGIADRTVLRHLRKGPFVEAGQRDTGGRPTTLWVREVFDRYPS
ncbi:MAG TPA: bifunctional DNA primase/helicase, partial [Dehalococcoidia bacterium]|nr:bifunctional DNA primase/helicase [Dehalococcoidia bacterium]